MMEEHVRASRVRFQAEQKKDGKQVREVRCARGHAKRSYFHLDHEGEPLFTDDSLRCPKCRAKLVKHWPFEEDEPKEAAEPVAEPEAAEDEEEEDEEEEAEPGPKVARSRRKAQSKKRRSRRRQALEDQEQDG